jgi:uncharacterized protein (TIGR02145 family)
MIKKLIVRLLLIITFLSLLINCKKDKEIETLSVVDIDSNIYNTVTIGTQTWMVENLKVTRFRNGDSIAINPVNIIWEPYETIPAYSDYFNDPNKSEIYGRLYNWYAINDSRNIAPLGWHIPTDAEWTILTEYLGDIQQAGGKLKETGTIHWLRPNTGATDEYGFKALPAGHCQINTDNELSFDNNEKLTFWWCYDQEDTFTAWSRSISYLEGGIFRTPFAKWNGFSVRCIKDN